MFNLVCKNWLETNKMQERIKVSKMKEKIF